jgi:hypothetical protein
MEIIAVYIVFASSVIGLILAVCQHSKRLPYKNTQYSRRKGDRHDD